MITIDYQNRKPIYEQIVERVQLLIASGIMKPDTRLPSVRSLAVDLSINPKAIQRAYACLEEEGYIYPVKGKGNYVSGGARLRERQQKDFLDALEAVIQRAKLLGLSREEVSQWADAFYREERGHD